MKTVLLVDDEEGTRLFVHFALKDFVPPAHLRYLRDGFQAMRYLEGYGIYSDRKTHPFPDLVLLDLNMPLLEGFEVLEWARSQPATQKLPIVVFADSSNGGQVKRALQLGATAAVTKVVDLTEFEQALKDVFERVLMSSAISPQASPYLAKAA